jgi:uncharacterized phiE125 gp8 family phage protein
MILQLVTAPGSEPVDLESMRLHLRVDDTTEDDLIADLITTARQAVENDTRRALLTQTWDYSLPRWPCGNAIVLPLGNLQTVTSVKWKNTAGTETTLVAGTDYLIETNGDQCGRLVLPYGLTWPLGSLYPSNPVTVRYVCGWTAPSLVPGPAKSAVKVLVAKLFESRGEDVIGQTRVEDKTYDRLVTLVPRLYTEF